MPAAMPVVAGMTAPVTVRAHLLWLDVVDIVLRDDGGLSMYALSRWHRLPRWQRCSLRACGQRDGAARYKADREFQKIPAVHDFSPLSLK